MQPVTLLGPFGKKKFGKKLFLFFSKKCIFTSFFPDFEHKWCPNLETVKDFSKIPTDWSSQNPAQNNSNNCKSKLFSSSKLKILQL